MSNFKVQLQGSVCTIIEISWTTNRAPLVEVQDNMGPYKFVPEKRLGSTTSYTYGRPIQFPRPRYPNGELQYRPRTSSTGPELAVPRQSSTNPTAGPHNYVNATQRFEPDPVGAQQPISYRAPGPLSFTIFDFPKNDLIIKPTPLEFLYLNS